MTNKNEKIKSGLPPKHNLYKKNRKRKKAKVLLKIHNTVVCPNLDTAQAAPGGVHLGTYY